MKSLGLIFLFLPLVDLFNRLFSYLGIKDDIYNFSPGLVTTLTIYGIYFLLV